MPASSLIFLTIIALWAAFLVPNAIRRHRRTAEARQADRDSEAMRVVVRRGSAPVGEALAAAAVSAVAVGSSSRPVLGPSPAPATPSLRSVPALPSPSSGPVAPVASPRAGSRVVARRRRLLASAAGVTAVGWALVVAGAAPWWSGAVPTLGLLLVVAALTRHGASAPARRAVRPAAPAATLPRARPSGPRVTVPAPRDERPSPLAEDRGWAPVPVPLPTYLLKDRARTWDPVSPAVAAAATVDGSDLHAGAEEDTRVIDLREHARVVNL
ncbi:hypothetical protein AB2L27_17895 [Kineococcus sp. LSe6-4]|uniref:Uncharacterized protein n=1 Tax=Kineococcus halophytocola TaxID=3234027 RepID=A0ABV4H4Y4_9ACTN